MDCISESAYIATVIVIAFAVGGVAFFFGRASANREES
jgi:hypothetical protein